MQGLLTSTAGIKREQCRACGSRLSVIISFSDLQASPSRTIADRARAHQAGHHSSALPSKERTTAYGSERSSACTAANGRPMMRLTEENVLCGLAAAWRRAGAPTTTSASYASL